MVTLASSPLNVGYQALGVPGGGGGSEPDSVFPSVSCSDDGTADVAR